MQDDVELPVDVEAIAAFASEGRPTVRCVRIIKPEFAVSEEDPWGPPLVDTALTARFLGAVPRLDELVIYGSNVLAALAHPALRKLSVWGTRTIAGLGIDDDAAAQVRLPALERLVMRLEVSCGEYSPDQIVLTGMPSLRELDLRGSSFGMLEREHPCATMLRAVARSPPAEQLRRLALPRIDDDDAGRLFELARLLPALEVFEVDRVHSSVEREAAAAFPCLRVRPCAQSPDIRGTKG